ncbi:acyl-CoA reductase-like NAD-dependent aldehyde dehydrogenase [Isoptericola jiangsuensis]|uniref:Acyl-CoA reductase-like NAD-dependent aldehyde dehydrogenase n=1 Tax=Isoptericola jiangsuensis TaxID=548579 RepID=A0A2A9EUQ2_9MICO|nr:acyl-CoA reductase-like NAD-dependent aldehyde dehydrogenase [Isoptericola jiangsuensis]
MSLTTLPPTGGPEARTAAPGPELHAYVESLAPAQGVWIDGAGRPAGSTFTVEDPATGVRITDVADGGPAEATAAVDAAAAALDAWAATPPRERSEVLRRAFAIMVASTDRLAGLMAWENGKALPDARAEVAYAAEFFRWFAEEAVRTEGEYGVSPAGGTRTIVTHKPVGVAALVTPWNFPAAMATRKIAPALAAGCTVVLKPAAETPLTALAVAQILTEAGVPDGVVNVVPTTGAAQVVTTWLEDPRVRKISFTGSTQVGRVLLAQAAERVVNTSMELGGNAPFVVGPDADVEAAVAGAMLAKLRNGGQACTAANRLYVHADVVEEFTARFGAAVEALQVGSAFTSGTQIGPLVSAKARAGVARLVEDAVAAGARIAHRAEVPAGLTGHFYPRRCWPTSPRTPRSSAPRSSVPWPRSSRGPTPTSCCARSTTPSSAWRRTCTPATCGGRCARRSGSTPAWSASTAAWSRTRRRRSAAPSSRASAARGPARACGSSRRRSTSASTGPDVVAAGTHRSRPRRPVRTGAPGRVGSAP